MEVTPIYLVGYGEYEDYEIKFASLDLAEALQVEKEIEGNLHIQPLGELLKDTYLWKTHFVGQVNIPLVEKPDSGNIDSPYKGYEYQQYHIDFSMFGDYLQIHYKQGVDIEKIVEKVKAIYFSTSQVHPLLSNHRYLEFLNITQELLLLLL